MSGTTIIAPISMSLKGAGALKASKSDMLAILNHAICHQSSKNPVENRKVTDVCIEIENHER